MRLVLTVVDPARAVSADLLVDVEAEAPVADLVPQLVQAVTGSPPSLA